MLDIPSQSDRRPLHSLIREGTMTITPELAVRILDEAHYDKQRRVDASQVEAYAQMMRRGIWQVTDPLSFAEYCGKLYLVNGRHRVSAVIAYGQPVTFRIAVNEVESMKDADELYTRYDTVMRRRSIADALNAVDLARNCGVSKGTAKTVYAAVGIIINDFVTPMVGRAKDPSAQRIVDLRIEACEPYWPAAQLIEKAIKSAPVDVKVYLSAGARYAVALTIAKYQPVLAEKFFRGVAEDDGLKKNDPRKVLLKSMKIRRGQSDLEYQIPIATAWNAFFEGRTIEIIRVADNMKLRIAGTPVTGRS